MKCHYCNKEFVPTRKDNIYCSRQHRKRASGKRTGLTVRLWRKDICKKYGLTINDYDCLFITQEGKCGICKRSQSEFKKKFAIDHSHLTGKVRGLLCNHCNVGLGNFEDNSQFLQSAITYLTRHHIEEKTTA